MAMLTKYPKTKLATIAASVLALVIIWGALAWPEWSAGSAARDAAATAGVSDAGAAPQAPPPDPQTPVILRRVYIITRSSASAASPTLAPAPTAPPPESSQLQPSTSAPQRSQPHGKPIARSRGS